MPYQFLAQPDKYVLSIKKNISFRSFSVQMLCMIKNCIQTNCLCMFERRIHSTGVWKYIPIFLSVLKEYSGISESQSLRVIYLSLNYLYSSVPTRCSNNLSIFLAHSMANTIFELALLHFHFLKLLPAI